MAKAKILSISCMNTDLKKVLIEDLSLNKVDEKLIKQVKSFPTCENGERIVLDMVKVKGTRKPNEYNNHVSKCMGEDKKTMKECAVEWKELKTKKN